jgi:hypothetical protein
MPTKLITSLDQLEPGMKTLDGWGFIGKINGNEYGCFWAREDSQFAPHLVLAPGQADYVFCGQEVEVPE